MLMGCVQAKSPCPERGSGFEMTANRAAQSDGRLPVKVEIQEAGESAVGAKAGANKDHGLLRRYVTPSRGSFHREPATVVRVTLERGSAQRAGQLRDRKSVARSSFRDAVTLIYHTGQILLGPFGGRCVLRFGLKGVLRRLSIKNHIS